MVLRDSFLASEKVKIVMLTCICPGMSSANHTLNSLRYAERLKDKSSTGGKTRYIGLTKEQVEEELREFMAKHGKEPGEQDEDEEEAQEEESRGMSQLFY
jgi:hypothetical protein